MIYLVAHFWAWWLSALAVGVATALTVARRPEQRRLAGWLVWLGLAFAAGLPVAYLHLLSGRPGFWLETGLALFAGFIIGAAFGSLIGGRSLRDHEAWAIGLIPLALVWWGADALAGRTLEQDLRRKAASAVERVGGDPLYLDVAGRDVLLPRDAANRDASAAEIARIPGVRRVAEVDGLSGHAAKAYEQAVAAKRATPKSETPRSETPVATPSEPARKEQEGFRPAVKPAPAASTGEKAPAEDAAQSHAVIAALPPSGDLDAAACQAALSATLAQEPIQFKRNSASIRRLSTGVLERLTLLVKRCPRAKIEVRGYGDVGGEGQRELSRQRAERVVDYLSRMGVERARLAAAGSSRPVSKDEDADSRMIEFVVDPRR